MEELPTISRNLLALAAPAWLFCFSTAFFPIIPLGFEATGVYGSLSYLFGASLALIALALTLVSLLRYGRTKERLRMCFWSIGMVFAFGALTLASIVIGSMTADTQPSNQSLQLTAGRSDASQEIMKTIQLRSTLAPASGG